MAFPDLSDGKLNGKHLVCISGCMTRLQDSQRRTTSYLEEGSVPRSAPIVATLWSSRYVTRRVVGDVVMSATATRMIYGCVFGYLSSVEFVVFRSLNKVNVCS